MSWEDTELGEVVNLTQGFAINKKSKHYVVEEGLPLLRITDMINQTQNIFIREDIPKKFIAKPDDIIFTRTGQVGLVFTNQEGVIHNNCFTVDPTTDKLSREYLFWFLRNPNIKSIANNLAAGAAQPDLNHGAFKSIKIIFPKNLQTQKKIASILSAYDDLIENNLKRIKLLEEAAQRIYKEWFVDFKFPNHENTPINKETGLPEGWERTNLDDLLVHQIGGGWGKDNILDDFTKPAFVIRGTDMPKISSGEIDKVPLRFHTESNLKSRKIKADDIIFEVSGGSSKYPVGRSIIVTEKILEAFSEDVMCASFCKLMRIDSNLVSPLYISLSLDYYYRNGITSQFEKRSASNIVNFNFKDFTSNVDFLIPDKNTMIQFQEIFNNLFNQKVNLSIQYKNLKEARDLLLPRLMNRTIEV